MSLKDTQKNWETLGKTDPLFAVLTYKDKQGGKWNPQEFFQTGKKEVAETMSYLKALGLNIPKRRALDFGCGVGRLTQALGDYFSEVCGVDIAFPMIELAKKYNQCGDKCRYLVDTSNNLKLFPNNNFDFILSKITLQHIEPEHSKNYLKEFLRTLAPGGFLIFQLTSEPLKTSQTNPIKRFLPRFLLSWYRKIKKPPLIEMYGIKREEVTQFLRNNGARIVDIQPDNSARSWISFQYCITK